MESGFTLCLRVRKSDGEWQHIAVSYNGSILDGQGTICLNGEKLTGGNLMWGNQSTYDFAKGSIISGGGIRGW